jgi:two-component system, sensor histidine kinase
MILLLTLTMAVTAAAVMYFTHRQVGDAMLKAEERLARNVLELTELTIRGGYNRLVSDKLAILSRLKSELKNSTEVAASVLDTYRSLAERGILSREEAQSLTLTWLRNLRFGDGELFILGPDGVILAGTAEYLEGTDMGSIRDLKGRLLLEATGYGSLDSEGGPAIFVWPTPRPAQGVQQMAHFLPVESWGWTLGSLADFKDIEAESQKNLDAIVTSLKKTFEKIRIGESGYVFLFNGESELVIPPPGVTLGVSDVERQRLDTLANAVGKAQVPIRYVDPFSEGDVLVESFATYFKAFDWYLVVVAPVDEIQSPAQALVANQSLIIGLVFVMGLLAAFFMIARIYSPLDVLAAYAKSLPGQDFTVEHSAEDDAIRQLADRYDSDEVGRLANAFAFMDRELRKNIRQVIASMAAKERLQAAEQTARAKDKFLANMSHEMRTPLHGILGTADLLLQGELSAKQKRFAQSISDSGKSLLSVINDMLDFSKIEALKLKLESTRFVLEELVEEVTEQIAESAQAKGLELIVSVAPECQGAFLGDATRLRQVLLNLCSNAVKFTKSGEIELRATMDYQRDSQCRVRVEVSDSGIGMTAAQVARVFDPFEQADNSTTRRFGGTGLGLSISKRLVELMQGQIWVHSTTNGGSRFWFTVALTRLTNATRDIRDRAPSPAVSQALLVHDNVAACKVLAARMRQFGVETTSVHNAIDALRLLRSEDHDDVPFDMALIDHPADTGGIDLARTIHQDGRLSSLRLILMVPMAGDDSRECEAADLGGICLTKPVRQAVLRDCLCGATSTEVNDKGHVTDRVEPRARESGNTRAHVLVVEDSPLNQELTREMLTGSGCRVTVVEDGRKALQTLGDNHFDLIFMDCQMPELDGYETTRLIRQREATEGGNRHIPIIALTANSRRCDCEACEAAGMDDYLGKPFSPGQLRDKLEQWIAQASTDATHRGGTPPCNRHFDNATDSNDPDAALLDQAALDNIRVAADDGSSNLLDRLIDIYFESSPKLIENIRLGIESNEPDSVRIAAHTLKSSSASLGAKRIARLCKDLEDKATTRKLAGSEELLVTIRGMLPAVISRLDEERSGTRPQPGYRQIT